MMANTCQIGILGGSFDPVHWGHWRLAQTALMQVGLDQVLWLPSVMPPHKSQGITAFGHRVAMLRSAIADQPAFQVSDIAAEIFGPSYAIDLWHHLQAQQPDPQSIRWYWIIGSDAFQTLPRWYRGAELARSCHWLVAPRSGSANLATVPTTVQQMADQGVQLTWQWLDMAGVEFSSGQVRQCCRQGQSIAALVPEPVQTYIAQHRLYTDS